MALLIFSCGKNLFVLHAQRMPCQNICLAPATKSSLALLSSPLPSLCLPALLPCILCVMWVIYACSRTHSVPLIAFIVSFAGSPLRVSLSSLPPLSCVVREKSEKFVSTCWLRKFLYINIPLSLCSAYFLGFLGAINMNYLQTECSSSCSWNWCWAWG